MKFAIKGSVITLVEDASLVENSKTLYPVDFIFDGSWDGFTKMALFKTDGDSVSVPLTDDGCVIPAECLKKAGVWLQVSVQGSNGGEDISTGWYMASFVMHSATIDLGKGGSSGSGLPDDAYDQIMKVIGDLKAAGFEGKTLVEVIVDLRKSISDTATDEEVDDVLENAFGSSSGYPGLPGEESPGNTATDEEVDQVLNDVFGKQP